MAATKTRSRLTPYTDGNVHTLRAEAIGMKDVKSIAGAFRSVCNLRGLASVVKTCGDTITVQAVEHSQAKKRGQYNRKKTDEPKPKPRPVASLSLLTDAFLRTIPGTAQARELASKLTQVTRAAQ